MNDISTRVAKNSFFVYSGKIINLAISFVVFIHLANYLGESSFGRFSVAIAYIAVFGIITNFGLNQILVRELSSEKIYAGYLLTNGIILKFVLSLISIFLANFIATLLNYSRETIIVIWIISFNLLFSTKLQSARTVFDTIFQKQLKMFYPIIFNIVDNLLFAILIYLFTIKYQINLTMIALIYTFCNIPGSVLILNRFLKQTKLNFKFNSNFRILKYLVVESFPLFLNILFSTLNTKIDILLLSWIKGEEDVGYFSAATRLVFPLLFLTTSFSISLFPLLSKYYEENKVITLRIIKFGLKIVFLIGLFLCVTIAFNDRSIFLSLYVSSYAPAIPSFRVLMFALAVNYLNYFFIDIFIAARQQKLLTIIMAVALIFNTILNLWLIPEYSYLGASYVRLFTYLLVFLAFYILFIHKLKIRGAIDYFKLFLLSFIYVLCQIFFNFSNLYLNLSLSLIIFLFLIFVLKVINKDEMQLLKNIIRRKNVQNFKIDK